jgi:hypothetical protein
MVSIVAIVAIVILVGLAVWFVVRESPDTLQIEIGGAISTPTWVMTGGTQFR